jgi:chromosome segregation ATPase
MRGKGWAGIVLTSVLLAGCATGRNYQADIDALNARVAALQGQLASKDQQLSTLQNQVNDERMAREAAESALRGATRASGTSGTQSDLK